jgi:hypothetical protein
MSISLFFFLPKNFAAPGGREENMGAKEKYL